MATKENPEAFRTSAVDSQGNTVDRDARLAFGASLTQCGSLFYYVMAVWYRGVAVCKWHVSFKELFDAARSWSCVRL